MQIRAVLVCLCFGLINESDAELFDRGGGMVYDDVLDIIWLQNASLGSGSEFDDGFSSSDGVMTWDSAVAWADSLVFGGFDDWRLPSVDVNGDHTDTGGPFNGIADCEIVSEEECRDNELEYMARYNSVITPPIAALFSNVQFLHWSGTESEVQPNLAFLTLINLEGNTLATGINGSKAAAWAVRDGDLIDSDNDGIFDHVDNCLLAANANQRDTDEDGYGNQCDADFDQNCVVNFIDLNIIAAFFLVPGDFDTDLNGDGVTNFIDFSVVASSFLSPPGPSGVTSDCD